MKKGPASDFIYTLKQYFSFSRSERRGFFLLSCIMVLLLLSLYFINFLPGHGKTDFSAFEKDIDLFEKQLADARLNGDSGSAAVVSSHPAKEITEKQKPVELFSFNPNNLPEEEWRKLGLSERQVHVIKNYESKGGKFFKKDDVKKMYCISPQLFSRLEPYIVIPEMKKEFLQKDSMEKPVTEKKESREENSSVEINTASSEDFQKLNGIGPAKGNAIIAYRDKLGGFISIEQVGEVYGMDSLFFTIRNHLELRILNIRKINLNTHDPSELRHPYLSSQLTRLIINYRNIHGNYKSIEEIKKLALVNEETYRKIAPYLKTE